MTDWDDELGSILEGFRVSPQLLALQFANLSVGLHVGEEPVQVWFVLRSEGKPPQGNGCHGTMGQANFEELGDQRVLGGVLDEGVEVELVTEGDEIEALIHGRVWMAAAPRDSEVTVRLKDHSGATFVQTELHPPVRLDEASAGRLAFRDWWRNLMYRSGLRSPPRGESEFPDV